MDFTVKIFQRNTIISKQNTEYVENLCAFKRQKIWGGFSQTLQNVTLYLNIVIIINTTLSVTIVSCIFGVDM